MKNGMRTTLRRHVPVKGRKGLYWTENQSGKVYEVRYRDVDGRNRFKVVGPDLKQAIAEQSHINVKLGKAEKVHYQPLTFGAVAEEWSQARLHRLAPGTERKYANARDNYLLPEFQHQKIRSITADQIALFLSRLRKEDGTAMSGSYAAGIYGVLHSIMEYAANTRRGYIPVNPCDSLEAGERPKPVQADKRAFTKEEAKALLEHSPNWFKPVLLTAMYTGTRPSEVIGLRWDDIDFDADIVHVRYQLLKGKYEPTKGRERRDVPLLPPLRKVLYALPTRFEGQHLFTQPRGGKVIYDAVQRAFQKAREDSGVDKALTMHACRHTFASALLQDGKDITWVSALLGHKSPKVTLETYAHVIQRDNRTEEASERLSEAIGDLG